jgi:hypothetical protein
MKGIDKDKQLGLGMAAIEEIFNEYVRMREHGLEVQEALRALRVYVETLQEGEREALATYLRSWEKDRLNRPIRPIFPMQQIHAPIPNPSTNDLIWVECPACYTKTRAREVFCYNCGQMLQKEAGKLETKQFKAATSELFSEDFFGMDSILVLSSRSVPRHIEMRPQLQRQHLTLGRKGDASGMSPDIDLSSLQASDLGVSRLHLAIIYDEASTTLQAYDLGSANGSFLNGQKLHPNERRVLRHGDQLRLGRLTLKINFLHPGEAIKD